MITSGITFVTHNNCSMDTHMAPKFDKRKFFYFKYQKNSRMLYNSFKVLYVVLYSTEDMIWGYIKIAGKTSPMHFFHLCVMFRASVRGPNRRKPCAVQLVTKLMFNCLQNSLFFLNNITKRLVFFFLQGLRFAPDNSEQMAQFVCEVLKFSIF